MAPKTPVRLIDLFNHYKRLGHQTAAIVELEDQIKASLPDVFNRNQPWYGSWISAPAPASSGDYAPAFELIKEFEGCHLHAYRCPAGVPTIGWGSTRFPDGRVVTIGETITQQEADEMLVREITRTADALAESVPYWDEMDGNQQGALISFAYNLGRYFYGQPGFNTISRRLRDKDWALVPDAMLLYVNPGSSFEAGLRRRRIAEGQLWRSAA